MWVLTLIHNDNKTTRVLRRNASLQVGRSSDYKTDPNSLYIGDLKVPKRYITISTGSVDPTDYSQTPLEIKFESICTTDVNGVIYKLSARDATPIVKEFTEQSIQLKVNANKSDRIKLRLEWVPVTVMAFSKRIMYEGSVQQSPLPDLLQDILRENIDVRISQSPFEATHYVTFLDHVDYNLQVTVSRGVPVMSSRWCEYLRSFPDDVVNWLYHPLENLFLSPDSEHYSHPNLQRSSLLKNTTVVVHSTSSSAKQVSKFEKLLRCLMPNTCLLSESTAMLSEIIRDLSILISKQQVYVFDMSGDISKTQEIFGNDIMDTEQLWPCISTMDLKVLRPFTAKNNVADSLDERIHPTSSQRRKRRKLERVNDTDFFSFSPKFSSQPNADADMPDPPHQSEVLAGDSVAVETMTTQANQDKAIKSSPSEKKLNDTMSPEPTDSMASDPTGGITSAGTTTVSTIDMAEPREENAKNKHERETKWIVPSVSLADAILSTKKEAEQVVKQELQAFDVDGPSSGDHIVIEEFDLKPPAQRVTQLTTSLYKGRKNYKNFSKKTPRPHSISRTFIELHDDSVDNPKVNFSLMAESAAARRIAEDFGKEIGSVSGYQPEPSQLFVDDSDSQDNRDSYETSATALPSNITFGFPPQSLKAPRFAAINDPEDDAGEVKFSFRRRAV